MCIWRVVQLFSKSLQDLSQMLNMFLQTVKEKSKCHHMSIDGCLLLMCFLLVPGVAEIWHWVLFLHSNVKSLIVHTVKTFREIQKAGR